MAEDYHTIEFEEECFATIRDNGSVEFSEIGGYGHFLLSKSDIEAILFQIESMEGEIQWRDGY